ncbi:MAG TPA: hypothetical protein VJ032_14035, partial [Thermoanaerobaculia bacterium]|nr:hypothetical protein [Thermoanaerobaculia bacterium]
MQLVTIAVTLLTLWFDVAPPAWFETIRAEAEARYAEKSFARAHELYEAAAKLELAPADRRWVDLRLADTTWRADAASPAPDDTARQAAIDALDELIQKSEHDRTWAEAEESAGDYYATHPRVMQTGAARAFYEAALDWWAGSDDIALARSRYLDLVWRIAKQPWNNEESGQNVGRPVLENAVKIAETPADRSHARFLLATLLLTQDSASADRGQQLLHEIIALGASTPWYDDALFLYAQQLESRGAPIVQPDGTPGFRPDFRKALALYRRIVAEFRPGQSKYISQAESSIRNITAVSIDLFVAGIFLPKSEQEVTFGTRNAKRLQVTFTAVDLTRDVEFDDDRRRDLVSAVRPESGRVVRTLTVDMQDAGDYAPQRQTVRLTPPLETGAYVVTARSEDGKSNRTLMLVSDAAIVAHSTPKRTEVFFADVQSGAPVAGARVFMMEERDNRRMTHVATTDANGLASIDTPE